MITYSYNLNPSSSPPQNETERDWDEKRQNQNHQFVKSIEWKKEREFNKIQFIDFWLLNILIVGIKTIWVNFIEISIILQRRFSTIYYESISRLFFCWLFVNVVLLNLLSQLLVTMQMVECRERMNRNLKVCHIVAGWKFTE